MLIHGDVSPKNIFFGPEGPVILDAECAWYGDPAFDISFCLNHLLLKSAYLPQFFDAYMDCFKALSHQYFSEVTWESVDEIEYRTATLLPALLLARIDGKSPVEYLTQKPQRKSVRKVAKLLLQRPVSRLSHFLQTWKMEIVAK